MAETVFVDGKFYPRNQAKVSVFDHGLLYGDGIFEGIRLYDNCIFRFQEHLDRLYSSAKYLAMTIPMSAEELTWATVETCKRNQLTDGYIRLVVTRGDGDLGLAPWKCKIPTVIVIAGKITLYPKDVYDKGLQLVTVPTMRMPASAMNARVKSCNYLNNILAKIEGNLAGCVEALMLNSDGYVVECTGDNIFIVKNGVVFTPPSYLGALRGITRDCILELSAQLGYEVREEPFTRFEVFDADECFMTGTAAEVVPVVNLDARPIADGKPGAVTKRLNQEYRKRVSAEGTKLTDRLPKPESLAKRWADARK
ncbi:MAG TPA: branched-chain-amino-acid transaminase [Candidatus Sumerlaeota bacterium]|nr:branched-chain-amino-acid transaminase [Candidatus Sumerlaeota bacterium]